MSTEKKLFLPPRMHTAQKTAKVCIVNEIGPMGILIHAHIVMMAVNIAVRTISLVDILLLEIVFSIDIRSLLIFTH